MGLLKSTTALAAPSLRENKLHPLNSDPKAIAPKPVVHWRRKWRRVTKRAWE
jgi:hypothetical protein